MSNELAAPLANGLGVGAGIADPRSVALDPRGSWYTPGTIEERLRMRAMLDQLRGSGVDTGGPAAFSPRDSKTFAGELDRWLARQPARSDAPTPHSPDQPADS